MNHCLSQLLRVHTTVYMTDEWVEAGTQTIQSADQCSDFAFFDALAYYSFFKMLVTAFILKLWLIKKILSPRTQLSSFKLQELKAKNTKEWMIQISIKLILSGCLVSESFWSCWQPYAVTLIFYQCRHALTKKHKLIPLSTFHFFSVFEQKWLHAELFEPFLQWEMVAIIVILITDTHLFL